MKVEKQAKKQKAAKAGLQASHLNSGKKFGMLGLLAVLTAAGIGGVMSIGKKAEATVDVVMLKDGAYKNQIITYDMLIPYSMLLAEYEKYSIINDNGTETKRFILWNDRDDAVGYYAGYPILAETPLEKRQLVGSRVDNSDTVLYSFPGKDIIQLNIGSSDLNAFKTFLKPGDKLNIEAIYSDEVEVETVDSYGQPKTEKVDVFKTETAFGNIMLADLINGSGNSILDIYSQYDQLDLFSQAAQEASSSWQESVTPTALLVALTPKEKEIYYKYLSKDNIEFRVSLPQRTN